MFFFFFWNLSVIIWHIFKQSHVLGICFCHRDTVNLLSSHFCFPFLSSCIFALKHFLFQSPLSQYPHFRLNWHSFCPSAFPESALEISLLWFIFLLSIWSQIHIFPPPVIFSFAWSPFFLAVFDQKKRAACIIIKFAESSVIFFEC